MRLSRFGPYVLAVVALAVTLALVVLGTAPPNRDDDPSSRVAGRAGTLALYTWLGSLGFQVHRVTGQFDTSGSDVLMIIDPRTSISDADAEAVMTLLGRGGDVVLAVSPASVDAAGPLLDRLRVSLSGARPAGDSSPAQPFDAADRVHTVPMSAGSAIDPAPYVAPLLSQGTSLTAIAEQPGGGGRAYVIASQLPFSNDGLRNADSATLVLAMLERARGGAIGFDEYHHGEASAGVDGAAAIFESPVGLALLLGVAAVVAYLALSGRRLGRPQPAHDPALVPTTASYVEAMAGLFARSRDRGAVAARYADELKRRLGPDAGAGDDHSFLATLQLTRPDLTSEAATLLARARRLEHGSPDADALLALARDTDALERRWTEPAVTASAQWRP